MNNTQSNRFRTEQQKLGIRKITALYHRLSREDGDNEESNSISNQRKITTKHAQNLGLTNCKEYTDDGYTGTNFKRPKMQKLLEDIENDLVECVIVKDSSRLGRNYLIIGQLLEMIFPEKDIRFISVTEGVDTFVKEDELAPFRSVMNELYVKSISKAVRAAYVAKDESGIPLGRPPYGYIPIQDDPMHWDIDEMEAGPIVLRIYHEYRDGKAIQRIGKGLEHDKIRNPSWYWFEKFGLKIPNFDPAKNKYKWSNETIRRILRREEYLGHVVNFKKYTKSYKLKKQLPVPKDQQSIHKDRNRPIVPQELWDDVHSLFRKVRYRSSSGVSGGNNIFSGLLVCADCGSNLNYHFNQTNPEIEYYNCNGYNRTHKICNDTHYIRVDALSDLLLLEIQRLVTFASLYEDDLVRIVLDSSLKTLSQQGQSKQKRLKQLQTRDKQLDAILDNIYEDKISGELSPQRFRKMNIKYETEQKDVQKELATLEDELARDYDHLSTSEDFLNIIKEYSHPKVLTPEMIRAFVHKIKVHHAYKKGKETYQKVEIEYNCVGQFELPDRLLLPKPQIKKSMRKGVAISYSSQTAV